jgi:hypothetical protein
MACPSPNCLTPGVPSPPHQMHRLPSMQASHRRHDSKSSCVSTSSTSCSSVPYCTALYWGCGEQRSATMRTGDATGCNPPSFEHALVRVRSEMVGLRHHLSPSHQGARDTAATKYPTRLSHEAQLVQECMPSLAHHDCRLMTTVNLQRDGRNGAGFASQKTRRWCQHG